MEEKIKELEQISNPIIEFLKKNYNPYTTIIINQDCVKVVTDEMNMPIQK